MKMQNDCFSTSDFPLGVTLISFGYKLDLVSVSTSGRASFYFLREDGLDDAVQAFWRDELRIEPKQFYLNQKLLKSRIFETK